MRSGSCVAGALVALLVVGSVGGTAWARGQVNGFLLATVEPVNGMDHVGTK